MIRSLTTDLERDDATRHEVLSASSAVAPLALVSTPQASFEVTTLRDVVDANDGVLSLREAIGLANDSRGLDTINFAEGIRGGTIRLDQRLGSLRITDDLVIDGDALDRGAGGIVIDGDIENSVPRTDGNGLYYGVQPFRIESANVRLEDLTIQNALYHGIRAYDADVAVSRATIRAIDGHPFLVGHGISARGGSLNVIDSTIGYTTEAGQAIGISLVGTDATIIGSRIVGNFAYYAAWGIAGSGSLRILDSTIADNGGFEYGGGGIRLVGAAHISGSTFTGNGYSFTLNNEPSNAISIHGSLNLVNSTIAETLVESYLEGPDYLRAAVSLGPDSRGSIVNSTITGTTSGYVPYSATTWGIGIGPGATLQLTNSIVDDSITGLGRLVSNGANTFRDMTVVGATATDRLGVRAEELFARTTTISDTGIRAGVAADNGGPTPTIALRNAADNPAIDGGSPRGAPATDQRGVPRDATPDIGAFELDVTPPTVAVAVGDDLLASGETALVTFSFSEPVRGFEAGDIVLAARGSIGDLAPGRGNAWTAVFTPADGVEQAANTIGVRAASYTDIAGNLGAGGTSPGFAIDTLPPSVVVGLSTAAVAAGETATVTFTFSEPVRGFAANDIELGAPGRITGLTQASDSVWAATFAPAANAEAEAATIGVTAASYTDVAGNAGSGGSSPAFVVDTRPPSVAIALDGPGPVNGPRALTFTFSEPVTGFDLADVDVAGAAGSLGSLAGSGAVRTAVFTPTSGIEQAANTIAVLAGGYTDLVGNAGGGAVSPRFAIDSLPPSVAIAISDTALTRGETATVTFAFSEAITGFEAADIDLRLAAGAISDLRERSGNTWTATFTPDDDVEQAASSIRLPAGSYTDQAGNPGGGAVSPVFSIDTTPPIPPVTLAPIAVDDLFAIDAAAVGRKGARLPILANDVAQTGRLATKSVVLLDEPEGGTVTLKKGALVYKPDPGFEGTEELRYTVDDTGGRTSNVATVSVTVTQPPLTQAIDDDFVLLAGEIGRKGARLDILVNDVPGFGKLDARSVMVTDGPDDGSFTVKKGAVLYQPDPGFTGVDQLTYTVADATGRPSNTAKVTIDVQPPAASLALADLLDAAPMPASPARWDVATATMPALETLIGRSSEPQSGAIQHPSFLPPPARNDEFVVEPYALGRKGAALNILSNDGNLLDKPSKSSVALLDEPVGGQAVVKNGVLRYVPDATFEGDELLHYTFATRSGSVSNVAEVRITVVRPPSSEAVDDDFALVAGKIGKKGARLDILVNDVPGFGKLDARSVVVTDGPNDGSFTVKKGTVLYQPDPGFTGGDELTYTVADATGRPSNTAKVTIDVQPPAASLALADLLDDGAPVAQPQSAEAAAGPAPLPTLDSLVMAEVV